MTGSTGEAPTGMAHSLRPGDMLANRYHVQYVVASGGMGTVYRAHDDATGRDVALKVLRLEGAHEAKRFSREAALLAELRHPKIVCYVDYGTTPEGEHYLAMEWLEGRPLSARLRVGALAPREAMSVIGQAAEALAAAHREGFVHRDVKPSNLFLMEGSTDDVRLIDFGVARRLTREGSDSGTRLTKTGALIGTTAYMAPEQAEGKQDVDARADVFALGVVFYECLTGRRAFKGQDPREILGKILVDDPPRVRTAAPEVPEVFDALVLRMMSRERWNRPPDGQAVLRELELVRRRLAEDSEEFRDRTDVLESRSHYLTDDEQRIVWALLVDERDDSNVTQVDYAERLRAESDVERTEIEGTVGRAASASSGRSRRLAALIDAHGGQLGYLPNGTLVATFPGGTTSTDQVSHAARCALEMRAAYPDLALALAAGPAVRGGPMPVQEVLDRGSTVLSSADVGTVHVEDAAVGLLESQFVLDTDATGHVLVAEHRSEPVPAVLGRRTPFVGRQRELAMLDAVLEESMEEPVARAVIVTGAAGTGKSRLRREFTSRLSDRGDDVQVLAGRADVLGAGTPFGIVADMLRGASGIEEREALESARNKLRARVAEAFGSDGEGQLEPHLEFLGEMARVPFPDDGRPTLAAARNDAVLMGDAMRSAWESFLRAESEKRALVLVLEDVHLGDRPSLDLVDTVLRRLEDRPIMVLAVGRPELEHRFPDLWAERHAQPIRLAPLTKRAREELVRAVLEDEVDDATRKAIVERSEGNALYLEELMRAVVREGQDPLPKSLLAMVQARLDALEPEARRVLRAASVFGEVFWPSGVAHLVGGSAHLSEVEGELAGLARHELVERRSDGVGEARYGFRHLLVRDGVYETLTEEDRTLAHRLAGEWLDHQGESNPLVLAEHFARGNVPASAARWYERAAEQALEGNDLASAIARADRALECGASGELRGLAELVRAEALCWSADFEGAAEAGARAVERIPAAGPRWFHAIAETCFALAQLDRTNELLKWVPVLRVPVRDAETCAAQIVALSRIGWLLHFGGHIETANELLDLARSRAEEPRVDRRRALPWVHGAAAWRAYYGGDLAKYLQESERAADGFREAGDVRRECAQRSNVGVGYFDLGDAERAERILQESCDLAERIGLVKSVAVTLQNLAYVRRELGRLDEAREAAERAVDIARWLKTPHVYGLGEKALASLHRTSGELESAEAHVRKAIAELEGTPALLAEAWVELAHIQLVRGDFPASLASIDEAEGIAERLGGSAELGPGEFELMTIRAEALHGRNQPQEARSVVKQALERLEERASCISSDEWRKSFLERVSVHRRLFQLAEDWGVDRAT